MRYVGAFHSVAPHIEMLTCSINQWCVNGTVSDCAGVGESDDPTPVTACGPLFVSDYETSANAGDASTQTIQGILNVVVCTELAVTSGEYRD